MITIKKANANEKFKDIKDIVRLIYETDDYIYPSMCSNDYNYFESIMLRLLNSNSIFSYNNIIVAKMQNNIAGIILSFTNKSELPKFNDETRNCFTDVIKEYFYEVLEKLEDDTLYLNNVCVRSQCRGKGIGSKLLEHLAKNTTNKKIALDCLEDNKAAVAFYKKNGFKQIDRYFGFSGNKNDPVACLKFEKIINR